MGRISHNFGQISYNRRSCIITSTGQEQLSKYDLSVALSARNVQESCISRCNDSPRAFSDDERARVQVHIPMQRNTCIILRPRA